VKSGGVVPLRSDSIEESSRRPWRIAAGAAGVSAGTRRGSSWEIQSPLAPPSCALLKRRLTRLFLRCGEYDVHLPTEASILASHIPKGSPPSSSMGGRLWLNHRPRSGVADTIGLARGGRRKLCISGRNKGNEPARRHEYVLWILVGGQNSPVKSWTKILAKTLAPLLLGID
jgi:hypothetical protein